MSHCPFHVEQFTQMLSPPTVETRDNEHFCRRVLTDPQGEAMVRHEAAEALGSIADPICMDLLKQHVQDPEPIVADSCIVALDMMDHELSNSFQYAAGIDGDALAPCGLQEQAVQ